MVNPQRVAWLLVCATACGSSDASDGTSFGTQGSTGVDASSGPEPTGTAGTMTEPTTLTAGESTAVDSSGDTFPGTPDLPPDDTGDPPPNPIPETCDEATRSASSMGCEFYAVELDNFSNNGTYAIVAANVQIDTAADVVVETFDGAAWTPAVPAEQIAAMDAFVFTVGGAQIDGSGIAPHAAYRVTSSVPIAAYQFNSYAAIATSDASLLLPTTAWDTLHRVASHEREDNDPFVWTSYFAVVSATPDTGLEIVTTDAWLAGPGVPAAAAGETVMLDLDVADVAQVAMSTTGTHDPTGTRIDSGDVPVAVFGGTSCSIILDVATFGACDHLEEQLPGVRLWGQTFVAARAPVRSMGPSPESSLWQIVASEDGTTVTFDVDGAVTGTPAGPVLLDAGEQTRFLATGPADSPGDFVVEADKPILVLNYTLSGDELFDEFGNDSPGDPAMIILPPVEQYLPRYVVLVPSGWSTDVMTIVRPAGVEVRLDGVAVGDDVFDAVGPTHEVGRMPVEDGLHRVESDAAVAITVVGYRADDSYGYAGGIGTAAINPRPAG